MNKFASFAVCVLATLMVGCGGVSAIRVEGKAIEGNVSFIAAVPANDPRLKGPGVEGAKIELVSKVGQTQGSVVGSGTSIKEGNFSVRLTDPNAVKAPADVRATCAGYLPATNSLLIPSSDMRLLVILKRAGGGPAKSGLSPSPETVGALATNRSQ